MSNHRSFRHVLTLLALGLLAPAWALGTTYTVTNNSGGTGAGSLGAAVASAAGDGASTSDTINYGSYSILMGGSYAALTKNAGTTVTVTSNSAALVILDGSASYYTPFDFSGGGTLHLINTGLYQQTINVGTGSVLELSSVRDFPGSVSITGAGSLLVDGGYTYLGGHSDFTGNITVSGATTLAANNSALGNAATITLDGGALQGGLYGLVVAQTVTITANGGAINAYEIDASILSSNGVTFYGSGATTFNGPQSYTGNTWDAGTVLVLTQNGCLGSGPSTIFFNGGGLSSTASVTLSQDVNITNGLTLNAIYHDDVLNGVISGSGPVTIDNGGNYGTWTFTSANSYSGGTTVNNGTLLLAGAGTLGTGGLGLSSTGHFDISGAAAPVTLPSIAGAGGINLGANQLFIGSDNSDMALSGVISGTGGTLVKDGSGALTLTGANSFTGSLLFNSGSLWAGNSSALGAGSVTMAGGSLAFIGGPRTVEVGGNYVRDAPATLKLGLASAYPYDQLGVAGQAHLGGTLQLFNYSTFDPVPGQSFLLIESTGGISGSFASVTGSFSNIRMLPVYYSNQFLMVAVVPSFTQLAATPNQKAVASSLDGAFGDSNSQNLMASLGLQASSTLPASYDQIAPTALLPVFQMSFVSAQAQASLVAQRFSQDDAFPTTGASTASRFQGGETLFAGNLPASEEAQMVPSSTGDGWSLFVERQSVSSSLAGDANAPGYNFVASGLTAGLDRRLSKDLSLGLLLGYGQGDTAPGGNGSVNATGGQAGLYGGWRQGGAYAVVLGLAGLNRYQTQRLGYGGYASGSTGGYQYSGQLSLGFDQNLGAARVGLFGSGQTTTVSIDGFQESGSLAPLSFSAQGETSVLSDLGARVSRRFHLSDFTFDPGLSLAWEHRYQGSADSLTSSFAGGTAFTVAGPQAWTDGVLVSARLGVAVAQAINLSAQFTDLVAVGNGGSQGFSGGVDMGL